MKPIFLICIICVLGILIYISQIEHFRGGGGGHVDGGGGRHGGGGGHGTGGRTTMGGSRGSGRQWLSYSGGSAWGGWWYPYYVYLCSSDADYGVGGICSSEE